MQTFFLSKPKNNLSVVVLENYNIYHCAEFDNKSRAIEYLKNKISTYEKDLNKNDCSTSIDVFSGLLKLTYNDNSDKIISIMICGLCKDQNETLKKELE